MKIEILDEVGSTNDYIKRYLPSGEDRIVVAKRQTGGKGTKGRSFLSNEGGVYLSALRFFSHFPARDAFRIMQHAAVAVCLTVEGYGAKPQIKWANDVLVNGKKIAGILIENAFSGPYLINSVVGIGLNVQNELGELSDIAVNLNDASGLNLSPAEVRARLIRNFCDTDWAESRKLYRERVLLGKIMVTEQGNSYVATARRVLDDGRLEIECNGEVRALSAAEISVKY